METIRGAGGVIHSVIKRLIAASLALNHLKLFPVYHTLRAYTGKDCRRDIVAAFNVALLAFPQGLAYAYIAGVPIIYGLYGSAVATTVGVLFSTTRFIVLGPTNATAILMFSAFVNLNASPEERLLMVPTLLVMVGLILVVGSFLRMASLIQFVSRTVITGYITSAAFLIIVNQVSHMFGLRLEERPAIFFQILGQSLSALGSFHWPSLFLAALTFLIYWSLRKVKWLPTVGLTLLITSILAWVMVSPLPNWLENIGYGQLATDLKGLKMLEWKAGGSWNLPRLDFGDISRLAGTAQALALLCVLEAISIGRSLAAKSGGRLDANQEMFAMGMANVGCGLFSGMVASGSLTRSSLNDSSGASTPMSGFFIGVICLLGAFTMAPLVNHVPRAALAALVTIIGFSLIDPYHIIMSLKATKSDASVFLGTLAAGLLFPLDTAIYCGTALAIILVLKKVSTPILAEYSMGQEGMYTLMEDGQRRDNPHISIVHVEGQLFFATAEVFYDQIRRVCDEPNLKVVILKMRHAQNLDATCIMALMELIVNMKERNRHLLISEVPKQAAGIFERTGLQENLGEGNMFLDDDQNLNQSTALAVKRAKALIGKQKISVSILS